MDLIKINQYMDQAFIEAKNAYHEDEVPIGCVIVSKHGETLASTYNLKEKKHDACAHAEILAIKAAGERLKGWRLLDCSIFVTLEPCPMCLSAILQSRIANLYFGAYDKKGGALSLNYNFPADTRLNHTFNIMGGIQHYKCSRLLSNYFRQKRNLPPLS